MLRTVLHVHRPSSTPSDTPVILNGDRAPQEMKGPTLACRHQLEHRRVHGEPSRSNTAGPALRDAPELPMISHEIVEDFK